MNWAPSPKSNGRRKAKAQRNEIREATERKERMHSQRESRTGTLLGVKVGGRIPGAGEKQNPNQKISVQTGAPARAETEVGKYFGLAALSVGCRQQNDRQNQKSAAAQREKKIRRGEPSPHRAQAQD
jgi:hypothetical protein